MTEKERTGDTFPPKHGLFSKLFGYNYASFGININYANVTLISFSVAFWSYTIYYISNYAVQFVMPIINIIHKNKKVKTSMLMHSFKLVTTTK